MKWLFLTHTPLRCSESLVQCHLGKVEAMLLAGPRSLGFFASSLANGSVRDAAGESLRGRAGKHGQSPHPPTWSSAIILSPSSSSSSSFAEQVVTGGGDGVQAEAGSSDGHFVALACGLGPASSLLAYGRVKSQMFV